MRAPYIPPLSPVLEALTGVPAGVWTAVRMDITGFTDKGVQMSDKFKVSVSKTALANGRYPHLVGVDPSYFRRGANGTVTFDLPKERRKWTVSSPADALETLHVRGLWPQPWAPDDEYAPRWWCDTCHGEPVGNTGWHGAMERIAHDHPDTTPLDIVSVVSVASLSVPTLATVASIVGELQPGAVIVWRVMSREALADAHMRNAVAGKTRMTLVTTFGNEEDLRAERNRGGPKPWPVDAPGYSDEVRAAWPALRALHACGVHLLECERERVVIGVEAVS